MICMVRTLVMFICFVQLSLEAAKLRRRLEFVPLNETSSSNGTLFPHGKDKSNRVAICLTGQLRSANITWTSGHLLQNANWRMFGPDDPPTTAGTIVEWLFRPLSHNHGVDVFMYLTAHPDANNSEWDGNPHTYEPMVGDNRACKIFSDNDIFKNTGNKFFCLVEPEYKLMNLFSDQLPQWKTYGKPKNHNEQALAQLHAIYRANLAAKEYALVANIEYAYKIRLRPDTAFVKPFPVLASLNFGSLPGRDCNSTIFYASKAIYKNGNEDWFNVGRSNDMDVLLDRYMAFISDPFIHNSPRSWWDLENHLMGHVEMRHKICLTWYYDIWMVVIRKDHHHYNTWEPSSLPYDWKEMSE